jgi:hypothetical protein
MNRTNKLLATAESSIVKFVVIPIVEFIIIWREKLRSKYHEIPNLFIPWLIWLPCPVIWVVLLLVEILSPSPERYLACPWKSQTPDRNVTLPACPIDKDDFEDPTPIVVTLIHAFLVYKLVLACIVYRNKPQA